LDVLLELVRYSASAVVPVKEQVQSAATSAAALLVQADAAVVQDSSELGLRTRSYLIRDLLDVMQLAVGRGPLQLLAELLRPMFLASD